MFGAGSTDGGTGAAGESSKKEDNKKREEEKESSLFGGSLKFGSIFGNNPLFGNTSSLFGGVTTGNLFNTSTLTSGSLGTALLGSNPFASYNVANLRQEGEGDENDDEEEEKAPSEHETGNEVVKEQLEPSPYTKLISVILKNKFRLMCLNWR